ncbi:MAG: NAD(P)-dependent oxidoreductase [Deltaproteobacteria bacterium]|nr:NAD(P)-dependent oxidoreductase [Deltaproteobacteria bacterium]
MLSGKTLFITGASRGIGLAIALRAAREGANIVIAAKTVRPHPTLPGTIHTAKSAIEAAGGRALACQVNVRFEEQVQAAIDLAVETFGGIDVLVNNASALHLEPTATVSLSKYDLMHNVNARGTFLCSRLCLPHLARASNPHILNLAPPINLAPTWLARHAAYTIAKYGMSMCVLGMAEEFRSRGVAVNALWPKTAIATAAVQNLLGGEASMRRSRRPEIVADAAHAILVRPARDCTGNFFIDEEVLRSEGRTDFSTYTEGGEEVDLIPDFFL